MSLSEVRVRLRLSTGLGLVMKGGIRAEEKQPCDHVGIERSIRVNVYRNQLLTEAACQR